MHGVRDGGRVMTKTVTPAQKSLLRAIADTGQPKTLVYVDNRKPWRLSPDPKSRGWTSSTFHILSNLGLLRIERGFAMRADVSLTDAGRALVVGPAKTDGGA